MKMKSPNKQVEIEMLYNYLSQQEALPTFDSIEHASTKLDNDYLGMLSTDKSFELFENEWDIITTIERTLYNVLNEVLKDVSKVTIERNLLYAPTNEMNELLAVGAQLIISFEMSNGKTLNVEEVIDVSVIDKLLSSELFECTLAFGNVEEIEKVINGEKKINISTDLLSPVLLANVSTNVTVGIQTSVIKKLLSYINEQ